MTIGVVSKVRATLSRALRSITPISNVLAMRHLVRTDSWLVTSGWLRSYQERVPVDQDGQPLPWIVYSAMAMLEPRLSRDWQVFEYGCGHSTLWWSRRVRQVDSCEHDARWYERIKRSMPDNVRLAHHELVPDGDYCRAVLQYGLSYDIIVIDGRDRVNCALQAEACLKPEGVVIWDNADRAAYQPGIDHLLARGFRRLDYYGMAPLSHRLTCTSLFYRDGNCLGL